jgi:ribosome recycling factor
MNPDLSNEKTKIAAAVTHFQDELKKLRTGRAHPSMLDGVIVTAYGTPMPIIQVATVSAPEAQLLQITPFDPGNIQAISSAIRDNPSLGMNPSDDGRVVRVPIPPLNQERRQQIAKQLGEKVEECMVTIRGVRHDALKDIDQMKKDKAIGEDDAKRLEKQIDEIMAATKTEVDAAAKAKEQEILTV